VLISDATASGNTKHFETTLEVVRDYYGLVMNVEEFARLLPQRAEQLTGN
jgi:ureidoacrylate peracid hydrolase